MTPESDLFEALSRPALDYLAELAAALDDLGAVRAELDLLAAINERERSLAELLTVAEGAAELIKRRDALIAGPRLVWVNPEMEGR
jgi:hypothetical protein